MALSLIITTTPTMDDARKIAHSLLRNKLSLCVQISSVYSVYNWDEGIEESDEYRLVIKASVINLKKIEEEIKALHSYKLPEIITIDIDGGSQEYLDWCEGLL